MVPNPLNHEETVSLEYKTCLETPGERCWRQNSMGPAGLTKQVHLCAMSAFLGPDWAIGLAVNQ